MALNLATLRTRTLTAVIFVVVMLVGLLWNHWSFFVLFSIIHFGCWVEYQRLVGLIDPDYTHVSPFHKYGVMLAGWCIVLNFTSNEFALFGVHLHEIGWFLGLLFVFILPVIELLFTKDIHLKNIGYSAVGLLYISLSWGLMMDVRSRGYYEGDNIGIMLLNGINSFVAPLIIIGSIWVNDTMAYIVGSLIGRTKMTEISPKKTWEGTIGGIILAIGVAALVNGLANDFKFYGVGHWMALAAIASIAGTFGDLLESKLKRAANVKDSGHFMPGHGGFLDRFDSLLVATPFCWLYISLAIPA
jgi:phosphatidate cytidylyltransferase